MKKSIKNKDSQAFSAKHLIKLLVVLCLFLISCKGNVDSKDELASKSNISVDYVDSKKDLSELSVGYSSPSLNAPFYVALSDGIKQDVRHYNMKFLSVDSQNDISNQIMGIEDLISQGIDILIVNPLDPKALVPIVNKAVKNGIPVFIVDSSIDPEANYTTSVLADNQGNGEILGSWIVDKMKGIPIKISLISGAPGNPVGKEKRMGFIRGIVDRQLKREGKADLDVVAQGWGNWNISQGLHAMEDILVSHPETNLVVAENDAMAIGALNAIKGADLEHPIKIVGFDGQKDALKLIKEGKLDATAINSPNELGRRIVNSVVENLNGNTNKGVVIHTDAAMINKNNVDDFYNPDAPF